MKKLIHTLIALFMVVGVQAKIIQVNNNAGASADYALLQTAIDNANSGDTLYLSGSPNYYDASTTVRLNKKLTLIGPGFFLGENNQTQSSNQTAKIYDFEIGEGADNSVLIGLDFNYSGYEITFNKKKRDGTTGSNTSNNVLIKRNKIDRISLYYASGTIIEQNYFNSNYSNIFLDETSSNTLIQCNIIITSSSYGGIQGPGYGYALSNTVIRSNTFSKGLVQLVGVEIDNNVLKNNVWVSSEAVAIPTSSTGNTLSNNKFTATAGDIFVKATPSIDNEFKLKNGSPAIGAGIDGIDAGAFGGISPYKLSGLPAIPAIYELTTTGIGTKENGLKVVVKAKSNN